MKTSKVITENKIITEIICQKQCDGILIVIPTKDGELSYKVTRDSFKSELYPTLHYNWELDSKTDTLIKLESIKSSLDFVIEKMKESIEKEELRNMDSQQEKIDCQRDLDNEQEIDLNKNIN